MAITLDLLDSTLHSVAIADSSGQALAIDSSGNLTVNASGGSFVVTATDLDIRDLSGASDSVNLNDGTNSLVIDSSGFLTANVNGVVSIDDNAGSITVDATALDIRALASATDEVGIGDGTNSLSVNADGSINVSSTPGGFGSWLVTQETVGTTESELVSTPLTGRVAVLIQNRSNGSIYLKEATGVSSSDLRIPKGSSFEASLDSASNIFAIADNASSAVVVTEYAA